jgi:hypothetical protein
LAVGVHARIEVRVHVAAAPLASPMSQRTRFLEEQSDDGATGRLDRYLVSTV